MERLQTPLKRGTKQYLTSNIAPILTEGLTRIGILRPKDPYLFLAQFLFDRCDSKEDYIFANKEDFVIANKEEAETKYQEEIFEATNQEKIETKYVAELGPKDCQPVGSGIKAVRALGSYSEEPKQIIEEKSDADNLEDEFQELGGTNQEFIPTQNSTEAEEEQFDDIEQTNTQTVNEDISIQINIFDVAAEIAASGIVEGMKNTLVRNEGLSVATSVLNEGIEVTQEINENFERKLYPDGVSRDEFSSLTRLCWHFDDVPLMIWCGLNEPNGTVQINATNANTLEKYHFECEGVNFDSLHSKWDTKDLVVKGILSELSLSRNANGNIVLGPKT